MYVWSGQWFVCGSVVVCVYVLESRETRENKKRVCVDGGSGNGMCVGEQRDQREQKECVRRRWRWRWHVLCVCVCVCVCVLESRETRENKKHVCVEWAVCVCV